MSGVLRRCRALRLLVAGVVITSLYVFVPAAGLPLLPKASADPVSGAFALGGGVGGSVDARTGHFSAAAPLVNVAGRGTAGVSLSVSWDQDRAGANLDRFGWGAGWSMGATFIDPTGLGTVYPASGGAYVIDQTFPSGLRNYTLNDLAYAANGGTLPARAGVAQPVDYDATVTYNDGKVDYFDDDGNLVARADRFGNRTDLTYAQLSPSQWQPTTIVDSYGLTTTFGYDDDGAITVSAPRRSDAVVPSTTVAFDDSGRVQSVTDPTGRAVTFAYSPVTGAPVGVEYLDVVTGPAGAQTNVTYAEVANPGAAPLVIAQTLEVSGVDGEDLAATRTFTMDPDGNSGHNYAGYPEYLSATEDALFASADPDYAYTTEISNGATATRSTYDSLHRMKERDVIASSDPASDSDDVTVQQQVMTYPDFAAPQALDPNYSRPLTTEITSASTSGPNGFVASSSSRTTRTKHTYDDHGRPLTFTDELGTTTAYAYDATYGLLLSTLVTGKDGSRRSVTNALSDDKKIIKTTSEATANPGQQLSARTVIGYAYDDFGQLSTRTVSWAKGAAPPDNGGGPASSVTSYVSTENVAAVTRTIVLTTAAGTPAASTTTTVVDLVSALPVKTTDALGRVTTKTYDAANQILTVTPPDGLVTATSYTNASSKAGVDIPTSKTVTEADGHVTTTSYDELGRTTTVTDNVVKGTFGTDPTARPVVTMSYSTDGTTVTSTDRAGRTRVTDHDLLGRVVRNVGPTGITKTTTYDDVANTSTARTYGDNATGIAQLSLTSHDALNREIASRTSYPVPGTSRPSFLSDPVSQTSYDGLGRPTSVVKGDLSAVPDYAGAGGVPGSTTIASTRRSSDQTPPITASDTSMLDGSPSLRTLSQPGQDTRAGLKTQFDAAGNVTSTTDPLGLVTSYTYTADGRPLTRTDPGGTVTTNTYDRGTGELITAASKAPDGTTTSTTYAYVPAGKPGAGLVYTLTDDSGTITYGYDADRHRTSVTYPDGSAVSATYRDDGMLSTSTDITGAVTTYAYFPDGTLQSGTQVRGKTTIASVSYTYDGLGRVSTIKRGNGLTTTHSYTPDQLLKSQVTTDADGQQVDARSYGYDRHHNLVLKTETTPKPSRCTVVCTASASTYGTWTTSYTYDSYDRLTGSAVYSGSTTTGLPITQLGYTLDVSGNIATTTRSTRTTGPRPILSTQVTGDQIDAAGQLTQRSIGSTTTPQTYDLQGRVLTALSGTKTTYRPDGLPATVTSKGATTTFSYWPDGSRRRATTVDPTAGTNTVDFHYGVDGTLVNDTTSQLTGAVSASYLITHGREARTLQAVSAAAGRIVATPAAPVTTGAGVGYLLRDRHSSVTAVVDSSGDVTNTYAYSDYGAPALLDGRPGTLVGAAAGTNPGQVNPLQYTGGSVQGMFTEPGIGTLMTPARFYDPSQGRFMARDTANVHNRYAGFESNPIMKVDPTGRTPTGDLVIDALYVAIFAVSAVLTFGADVVPAAAALGGAITAEEVTAAVVVPVVANTVSVLSNGAGAVFDGARLADDISTATGKGRLLSDDERTDANNASTVAGSLASFSGLVKSALTGAHAAVDAAEVAGDEAPTAPTAPKSATQVNEPEYASEVDQTLEGDPQRAPNSQDQDGPPRPDQRDGNLNRNPANVLPKAPPPSEVSDPVLPRSDPAPPRPRSPSTVLPDNASEESSEDAAPLLKNALNAKSVSDLALNAAQKEHQDSLDDDRAPTHSVPSELSGSAGPRLSSPGSGLDPQDVHTVDRNNLKFRDDKKI